MEYQKSKERRKRKMEPVPDGIAKVVIVLVLAGTMMWLLFNWLARLVG